MARFTLALAAMLSATAAFGEEPALIEALRKEGAEIAALERSHDVDGWHVQLPGASGYALYALPEGGFVAGLLYDAGGGLVTAGQLEAAGIGVAAEPESPEIKSATATEAAGPLGAEDLLARTESLAGFKLGAAGPVLHVFADPGCPWSRSLVAGLGKQAAEGALRAHVIPVAILGSRSVAEAAAIAGAADPASAWLAPGRADSSEAKAGARAVAEATAIFETWRAPAVPFTVFRSANGIRIAIGAVEVGALLREAGVER